MFFIQCPHCGESREEMEFTYAGEAFVERPLNPDTLSSEQWQQYLFMRSNNKGIHWEQWTHTMGCRKFFVVKRNTVTNEILGVWDMSTGRNMYDKEQNTVERKSHAAL